MLMLEIDNETGIPSTVEFVDVTVCPSERRLPDARPEVLPLSFFPQAVKKLDITAAAITNTQYNFHDFINTSITSQFTSASRVPGKIGVLPRLNSS